MEILGLVKKKGEVQEFDSGFKKIELIVQTQEQYPQPILIEFSGEKINLLDNVNFGDRVKISINIRGREWQDPQGKIKYFNSITGWKVEKIV